MAAVRQLVLLPAHHSVVWLAMTIVTSTQVRHMIISLIQHMVSIFKHSLGSGITKYRYGHSLHRSQYLSVLAIPLDLPTTICSLLLPHLNLHKLVSYL